ncbi:MAG: AAA family ATPase [Myxococcales bacterium]|nr:AAA family ATPase [Myxococcales bacterium]
MVWYRFGDFELDLDAFCLKRGDRALALQPKVLDVLRYLVEHRGRMVSKNELLDELWRDEFVNEAVITWSVSHIRRAVGQRRGEKTPIETVHGRGYRFVAKVTSGELPAVSPAPSDDSKPRRPALVGRAPALRALTQHVKGAAAGRGSLCLVTGEPGIGKTRIVDELARVAPGLGVLALVARCPEEASPPLWPIIAALSGVAGDYPEIAARARALTNHDAEADSEATAQNPPTEDLGRRFRLIEQASKVLADLAAEHPTLLVLDDLHWADASTFRLLSFLAPELSDMRLCVALTMRNTERPRGGSGQRWLNLMRGAHSFPLGTLDADQVAELVEAVSGRRPSSDLAQAIRRAAGGVPLFVLEVVRALTLEHGDTALAELPPEAVSVPELARDLLRERIRRLPSQVTELLSRAAVIGESFDLSLLATLTELEPDALLERLEPAIEEGQLISEAPHTFRFVHSLFRSTLYDDLPPTQRVTTHRMIGRLLETRPSTVPHLGEIARHYYLSLPAGDHAAVVQHASKAGDAAMRAYAFEDAAGYFRWALEAQAFGGTAEPRTRAQLVLSLAVAQRSAGRIIKAMEASRRVIELGLQHQLYDLVVAATHLRRPTVAMAMVPDDVSRQALETVVQGAKASEAAVRGSALSQLSWLPPYGPDLARSKAYSTRALALAEERGDEDARFEALRARLFSLSGPDDIDAVLALADQMLALQAARPRNRHRADARSARFMAHLLAGQIAEADATLDEVAAAIPGPQWPEATFYCERLRAQRAFQDGNFDQAAARYKALHKQARRAGVAYADFFLGMQNLHLEVERKGSKAVFTRRTRRALSEVPNATPAYVASTLWLAAQAGDISFVQAQLPHVGDPSDYPRDASYLHRLASLSICAAAVDDQPRSEQLLALLTPYAGFNTPDALGFYLGSVCHFLGLLEITLARPEPASEHLERAIEHNESMGYRAGVVRSLMALARLRLGAGRRAVARELFERALSEAQSLGMTATTEEAEQALSK